MKKIRGLCLPVMLGAVSMSQHTHVVDNLTFKGKLIIPARTVQNVEVSWGDIEIQNLAQNGENREDFTIDMNRPCSLGAMRVTIASDGQTDNSVLVPNTSTASGDGLLIYLYNSSNSGTGNAVTLGGQFTSGKITGTTPARKITLYAKLGYKGNMQSSRAGAFSVTATLAASCS